MPWSPEDAHRKTHKADSPHKQAVWAAVANRVLQHTGDEALAVRTANGVIRDHPGEKKRSDDYIHWSHK